MAASTGQKRRPCLNVKEAGEGFGGIYTQEICVAP